MDPTEPDVEPEPTTTPAPPPARPARAWCLFRCGPAAYALGLESVAEVVEVERLVGLPQSPPRVLGLCSLRREVVPVLSLDPPGAAPAAAPGERRLVLIVRSVRGPWGVRIDGVGTVVAEAPLEAPAPPADGSGATFLGTVRRDEASYSVIDPVATWRDLRRGVDEWYAGAPGRDPVPHAPKSPLPAKAG